MDQVEEIKNKTDIVAIAGEHIQLTKAGRNYKALCPFHQEKTPSFIVSPELQIYKCFSCGESGDVISFLEKYEGLEFYDVLKILAKRAGVELKTPQGEKFSEKDRLIDANDLAAKLYNFILTKHTSGQVGLDYLTQKRGLTKETITKFNLGYAPDVSYTLSDFLITKKKFTAQELEKAGLVVRSKGRIFDRFRGRIIFPLYDHRNICVGLAGRILPVVEEKLKAKGVGKYVNSPETPIYHKSKVLYGLNVTKTDIKQVGAAVIVEGEVDFLSLWQNGIKNVVAIKGTALTEEQIKILSRFTDTLILALDSDIAGDGASRRGIAMAQNLGMKVKVLVPSTKYKDPDDYVRHDLEGLKMALSEAESVWDFLIASIFSKVDATTGEGKASISRELVPILTEIDDKIVQTHYVGKVAKRLAVPEEAVWDQIKKIAPQKSSSSTNNQPNLASTTDNNVGSSKKTDRRQLLEEQLLALGLQFDPQFFMGHREIFQTTFAQKVFQYLPESLVLGMDLKSLLASLPKEVNIRLAELLLAVNAQFESEPEVVKKEMGDLAKQLEELHYRTRLAELTLKISQDEAGDGNNLPDLTKEFTRISKLLSELDSN